MATENEVGARRFGAVVKVVLLTMLAYLFLRAGGMDVLRRMAEISGITR